MRVLLDVSEAPRRSRPHTFLWFVGGDGALSKTCLELIEDQDNAVLLSIASLWEVAIKMGLGKLEVHGAHTVQELVDVGVSANRLELLGITPRHLDHVRTLPFHHRDPFNRILVAQALSENLVLLSRDRALAAYDVQVLW